MQGIYSDFGNAKCSWATCVPTWKVYYSVPKVGLSTCCTVSCIGHKDSETVTWLLAVGEDWGLGRQQDAQHELHVAGLAVGSWQASQANQSRSHPHLYCSYEARRSIKCHPDNDLSYSNLWLWTDIVLWPVIVLLLSGCVGGWDMGYLWCRVQSTWVVKT